MRWPSCRRIPRRNNHLPSPHSYKGGSPFYHGLTPDQKIVIFAGEGSYRDNLVAVTDGLNATIKTDRGIPSQLP
ncbi:MAG: hypothetical protein JO055_10495 [Alphaproteobacteria bacterium]|nr:hypothetical protein [Alphaproteobacteria bacterium]